MDHTPGTSERKNTFWWKPVYHDLTYCSKSESVRDCQLGPTLWPFGPEPTGLPSPWISMQENGRGLSRFRNQTSISHIADIYIYTYIYIYIFTVWAIRETLDVSLVNVYLYLNYKYKYNIGLISLYFKQKTSSMKFPVMFLMPCQRLDIYLTLNSYFQNEWIQSTYTYLA